MDVLNSLVTKASELGLLQPLMRRGNFFYRTRRRTAHLIY